MPRRPQRTGTPRGLAGLLYALRLVGPANAWRALAYSLRRAWRARRPLPPLPGPRLPLGPPLHGEPTAHGARVHFAAGVHLELTFLAPETVRLSWHPGPRVPDWGRPPWPHPQPRPIWQPHPASGLGQLRTAALHLHITPAGLVWQVPGRSRPFRYDPWPWPQPRGWLHRVPLPPEAAVLGLGLRAAGPNLRPGTYRLWNRDPGGSYGPGEDPLYLSIPVVWVVQPGQWPYLWFYENPAAGEVRLNAAGMTFAFEGGPAQALLVVGPPRVLARRWAAYSGFPALPPRWALGFHQSRWGYRTQAEVEAVLRGYADHDLPLHALHLDIDHMHRRRVFTVDARRFPNLPQLQKRAAAQGVRLVPIVDPGVAVDPHAPRYRQGRAQGYFCTDAQGREVHAPVWPGWCAFPDFTRPEVRAWWQQAYAALWTWGAAGVWHDMNEPATFAAWGDPTLPPDTRHLGEPPGDHRLWHNLYGLHMNRAGWEAQRAAFPQRRPWLLSRSGWAGVQRQAWNWSADLESSWPALRLVIPQALHLALSGQPYYGPDIGGFSGDPGPDLFVRWFQLAAWLPFFRLHSSIASAPREPWRWPSAVQDAVRRALQTRVRWLPYWYTLAWWSARTGEPLVRPLGWVEPTRPAAWLQGRAFLVGPALQVWPVLEPRSGPAPDPGPGWFPLPAEGDGPRVFLRQGWAVPTHAADGALEWWAVAPRGDKPTRGWAYFDAGDGFGPGLWVALVLRRGGRGLQVRLHARGAYPFPYARQRVRVLAASGSTVVPLPPVAGAGPMVWTGAPEAE